MFVFSIRLLRKNKFVVLKFGEVFVEENFNYLKLRMNQDKSALNDKFKAYANDHNIVGQQHAILLAPTCFVRLHGTTTMLVLVAYIYSLKPAKLLGLYKRTQHCWPTTRKNVVTC